jgi:hypothetical protein
LRAKKWVVFENIKKKKEGRNDVSENFWLFFKKGFENHSPEFDLIKYLMKSIEGCLKIFYGPSKFIVN